LQRNDFAYVGLIGSRTKAARFQQRLSERNISNASQLVCPIGILGISGKQPAVVALSVAAALAQLKHTHINLPETI
jgi:xanthine dehydrogenase accessory factor